jgi:alginate O-acetyltransferase complex protein AlgI
MTFLIVCISWVFFRADTLAQTRSYTASMFGLTHVPLSATLAGANLYSPYHVVMFAVCAVIVWSAPQTWNFTQKLTFSKAAVCLGLLVLSIVFMWTQTVNPFLYFQF